MTKAVCRDIITSHAPEFHSDRILNAKASFPSRRTLLGSLIVGFAGATAAAKAARAASTFTGVAAPLSPAQYVAEMTAFGCECFALTFVKRDGTEIQTGGVTEYGAAFKVRNGWPAEETRRWDQFRRVISASGSDFFKRVSVHLRERGYLEYCGPGEHLRGSRRRGFAEV